MSTIDVLIVSVFGFMAVGVWCSAWRAIRFKMSDDWLTAQREGYAATRNATRDAAKLMHQSMTMPEE